MNAPGTDDLTIEELQRACELLRLDDDPAVRAIGMAVRRKLDGSDVRPLDQVLGLKRSAFEDRDRLIKEIAARFFPGLPYRDQARKISDAWTNYTSSAWVREARLDRCPGRREETLQGLFWKALKMRPHQPSYERIRKLLAGSLCNDPASASD